MYAKTLNFLYSKGGGPRARWAHSKKIAFWEGERERPGARGDSYSKNIYFGKVGGVGPAGLSTKMRHLQKETFLGG